MLKGKVKTEILNEPNPDFSIDMIGSAACYNVYVVNEHGVPIVYLHCYSNVVYQYNSNTQETTEIPNPTTNEARVYAGFDIQTPEGISKIEVLSGDTLTWLEPLAEVTTTD